MRMIDANSAKEALECTLVGDAAALAQRVIDRMPTIDAVPVVRCRECVFKQRTGRCVKTGIYVNDDGFCSYGEKDGTK